MDKDFWDKVNRLEELAGKATQGEWNYCGCEIWANETVNSHNVVGKTERFEDAKYIAAANTAMIQEMIAELKSLDDKNYNLKSKLRLANENTYNMEQDYNRLEKEANWLAEELASVYKSEFEGTMDLLDASGWRNEARKAVSEADNA